MAINMHINNQHTCIAPIEISHSLHSLSNRFNDAQFPVILFSSSLLARSLPPIHDQSNKQKTTHLTCKQAIHPSDFPTRPDHVSGWMSSIYIPGASRQITDRLTHVAPVSACER